MSVEDEGGVLTIEESVEENNEGSGDKKVDDEDSMAVNGKMDLGVRKLVVSHVENATSIFAYQSKDSAFMSSIKLTLAQSMTDDSPPQGFKPKNGRRHRRI